MREYNETTDAGFFTKPLAKRGNFVPPDDTTNIPGRQASHVVVASNMASPVSLMVVAGVMLVAGAVVLVVAIWQLTGWHLAICAIIGLGMFLATGKWALEILNGDAPALTEIRQSEKTERQRIAAQLQTNEWLFTLRSDEEGNRHTEEMARIAAQTHDSRLRADVAWLIDQQRVTTRLAPPQHNYVPAVRDDARAAVETWIEGLWDRDDNPTFTPGQLAMPWNSAWKGQPWRDEAQRLLMDSGVIEHQGRTIRVVAENRFDALSMLAQVGR